jgi:hypothetical protein
MAYSHLKPKTVFVRPYVRFRLGRIEGVRQHWRSFPGESTTI